MTDDILAKLSGESSRLFAVNTTTAILLFGLVGLLAAREILFGAERNSPEFLLRMERPLDVAIIPLTAFFVLVFVAYAVSSSS